MDGTQFYGSIGMQVKQEIQYTQICTLFTLLMVSLTNLYPSVQIAVFENGAKTQLP